MDGPFRKLRFPRKPSKGKSNGPISSNAFPEENPPYLEGQNVFKINRVREEPQLIGSDAMISEPTQPASTVHPGDDPLSQFAAKSSSPRGNGSGETSNAFAGSGVLNHGNELMGGEMGGGVQYGCCLSEEDHRSLKGFVIDLVTKKLLPHLNEVLKNLNEWVSRKVEDCDYSIIPHVPACQNTGASSKPVSRSILAHRSQLQAC